MLAYRLATASNPLPATVVKCDVAPSAVSALADVDGPHHPVRQRRDRGGRISQCDAEVPGEVVARTGGHDSEHALRVERDVRQLAHRPVAPRRDDAPPARERVGGELPGCCRGLGLVDGNVEVRVAEGAGDPRQRGASCAATRVRVEDRSPPLGKVPHGAGA